MLEWLKKIGGSKPWQNKAGLEEKAVALLAEDFRALEKLSSDLPPEIVRYLLDGEGEEVLARLAGTEGAGELLGCSQIRRRRQGKYKRARPFF